MRQPPAHQAAYEELLRLYAAPLRRLAQAYAHSSTERDDLFQEIALALWTALPGFRGDASTRTWLYRVAHNTAIRFTTKRSRRGRYEQPGAWACERAAVRRLMLERAAVASLYAEQGP